MTLIEQNAPSSPSITQDEAAKNAAIPVTLPCILDAYSLRHEFGHTSGGSTPQFELLLAGRAIGLRRVESQLIRSAVSEKADALTVAFDGIAIDYRDEGANKQHNKITIGSVVGRGGGRLITRANAYAPTSLGVHRSPRKNELGRWGCVHRPNRWGWQPSTYNPEIA